MYPGQSRANSDDGGALWWIEGSYVKSTQFATLVWLFQMKFRGIAGGSLYYYFPKDGTCANQLLTTIIQHTVPPALNPTTSWILSVEDCTIDGEYGLYTAAALGALLCSAGLSDRAKRLSNEINSRTLSTETLQELAWFALHVTAIDEVNSIGSHHVTSDLPLSRVEFPDDVVKPRFDQPNRVAVADLPWVGTSMVGGPPPTPPSVQILQATGQPAETVPEAAEKNDATIIVGKSIFVAGIGGLAAVLWAEREAIRRALGL